MIQRFDVLRRVEFKPTSERTWRPTGLAPVRLAPDKQREKSKTQETRRIHAQRRARRINNTMVGWRDAHSKQGL
jgi:hypothetical protein